MVLGEVPSRKEAFELCVTGETHKQRAKDFKGSWPDEDRFAAGIAKINLDGKGGVLKSLGTWAKKQQALRQPSAAAPGR